MEQFWNVMIMVKDALNIPLVKLGKTELTVWGILIFVVLLILLFFLTSRLKKWISVRLLSHTHLDLGARDAIGSIFRYFAIVIGFVIILQTAGIDLSALTIFIGSLSIGVGLGLQSITNNFVSGLIILIERPIRIGDRIEFGKLNGDVIQVSARATTLLTNDNIAVIVPNSEIVSSAVINWSYPNTNVRFNIPVGVSYNSDPEEIKRLLLEIAAAHSGILKNPPPDVLFDSFGDNSLNFNLRVWTATYVGKPGVLRSELNYEISKKFRKEGVEIPFPQRDIHIRSSEGLKSLNSESS
jgi:small-conductance mechanosensitive channel